MVYKGHFRGTLVCLGVTLEANTVCKVCRIRGFGWWLRFDTQAVVYGKGGGFDPSVHSTGAVSFMQFGTNKITYFEKLAPCHHTPR